MSKTAKQEGSILRTFKAYEISWRCNKGHLNFQTILDKGTQHDICLKCGKHYEYEIK